MGDDLSAEHVIDGVLEREGWPRFTIEPGDAGGPTKGGITLGSWREYSNNPSATEAELAALTEAQARAFYRRKYIEAPHFDRIVDEDLQELVVDAGVLHGTRHAAKWLQYAADVKQDGDVGDKTIAAVNAADPAELFLWVCAFRIRLFGRLAQGDPELARATRAGFILQARFVGGWNNRVADFIEHFARRIEARHRGG